MSHSPKDQDLDDLLLKGKRKTDKMLRFNAVIFVLWIFNTITNLAAGNLWFALIHSVVTLFYLWLTFFALKRPGYWWRMLRPTYVQIDNALLNVYRNPLLEREMVQWARDKFNTSVYYHEHGVFAFRYPKHAAAFKLRWAGVV